MIRRKRYRLRQGDIIEVEEYHDGRYGGAGNSRKRKEKPTPEAARIINSQNKAKKCRQRMLEYFREGDVLATWTYEVRNRPPDMEGALKDFQKAMRRVRTEYRKRGYEVFWIRNIERGTKGAWHIHLLINEIGDAASILMNAWNKGGTWTTKIKDSKLYSADMSQLASYMTKDQHTRADRKDGMRGKPRLAESSYSTSRNMPLPEPEVDKLQRWKREPKAKKGYHIAKSIEGINPVTGYRYRRYTMVRLKPEHGSRSRPGEKKKIEKRKQRKGRRGSSGKKKKRKSS